MATRGDTSVRVTWSTKESFRKAVIDRGFPSSISDEDALKLLVQWMDRYVPKQPVGAIP